jgi:hypothetical protein
MLRQAEVDQHLREIGRGVREGESESESVLRSERGVIMIR